LDQDSLARDGLSKQMCDEWKSYRSAPSDGVLVCSADSIPDAGFKSVVVTSVAGAFPILVFKKGNVVHAFVNACPHQYLPLDHRGDSILSADGTVVRCTNHAAGFCVSTGLGVEGLGIDQKLDAVPVRIDELGRVVIDDGKITADTADNNA
jgi:nitrite reductase/ring-hydroxylating ferredoxin subunit